MLKVVFTILIVSVFNLHSRAQSIDEDQLGAWYMYFWSAELKNGPFGFQGDVQHRNWDAGSDLEQLLLRGGFTFTPPGTDLKLTLGYANITSGTFGNDKSTRMENRVYQEALFPKKIGNRIYLNHRFRYEQRWVEGQDRRTRYRYNLFLNIPLNKNSFEKNALYLALYNEIFINGERSVGGGNTVEVFDRNRTYGALGYVVSKKLRVQFGAMRQITDSISKNQAQLSLHHSF